jgi:uncharacterized protein (DUF427 family)
MTDDALRLPIPATDRLRRIAQMWRGSPRPIAIVTPGPGQESVWDYPRPPAVERVPVRVQVFVDDACIADTRAALRVLETASPPTVYLPRADVQADALRPAPGRSMCEWKGAATYFAAVGPTTVVAQAAWSYEAPEPEYTMLAGMVAFYPGRVTRCLYGGEVVQPQPGQFYGGWITTNLVGPFKGEPGSQGW